jgi:hypothetical protein
MFGAVLGGALGFHGLVSASGKKGKKGLWCHCPDGNPDNCFTLKLKKQARKRHKTKHPFDYAGECQPLICPPGQTNCGGTCKDLQADPANCGTCGTQCAEGFEICLVGDCCRPPAMLCAVHSQCCSNACLPANMGIPFPHCA